MYILSTHKKSPASALAKTGHITWQRPNLTGPIAPLPSAQDRFTSGFGMGPRVVPTSYGHQTAELVVLNFNLIQTSGGFSLLCNELVSSLLAWRLDDLLDGYCVFVSVDVLGYGKELRIFV